MRTLLCAALAVTVWAYGAPPAAALGATSIEGSHCTLPRSVSGLRVNLSTDARTRVVATPSGEVVLQCHFDIPAGYEPDRAFKNEGFRCRTFKGTTYNSSALVTPGGKAHLECQIKRS